ncbi:MAG: sulfite exporter TauE/SafE family protein [Ignavibacteriaceae bacterium]|nr:sulfite exporter TauE/SafE family protein [Ignavibacteriaceae bacterium]
MSIIESSILLFVVGSAAGFLNVLAGGGSSLTLPVLIFLGLEASIANGTNRIAVLVQNISAVHSFKQESYTDSKLSFKLALLTLPGAIAGSFAAVRISNEAFEKILGIVMIGVIISLLIPMPKQNKISNTNKLVSVPTYVAMFVIGFYGAFIQVGVGFLLMAALHYLLRVDLVRVNMHKVFIVLIFTIPALIAFILTDNINWTLAISLSLGNAFGAWWSAKVSVKKGEGFIKMILIAAVLIMALKLLKVF